MAVLGEQPWEFPTQDGPFSGVQLAWFSSSGVGITATGSHLQLGFPWRSELPPTKWERFGKLGEGLVAWGVAATKRSKGRLPPVHSRG
jgi:hypothetical protein